MNGTRKSDPAPGDALGQLENCIDQAMMAIDQAIMAVTGAHRHALALAEAGEREAACALLQKLRSAMETWILLMELLEERLELDRALKPGNHRKQAAHP
ncbi:MAG: hypothetical protein U1E45_03115 [Geminicoccaceae bacterium]